MTMQYIPLAIGIAVVSSTQFLAQTQLLAQDSLKMEAAMIQEYHAVAYSPLLLKHALLQPIQEQPISLALTDPSSQAPS